MRYEELSLAWQRVFSLAWESLTHGSIAIAAVIVSETGEILSQGRNRVAENYHPNYLTAHAEMEAVTQLDLQRYPTPKQYTLVTGLEPCPMCLGTLVMGHIRHVTVAARDTYGGALELLDKSAFLRSKNVQITYEAPFYGAVQRTLQALRELLFDENEERRADMLQHIRMVYPQAERVATRLVASGYAAAAVRDSLPFPAVFDTIAAALLEETDGADGV